MLRKILLASLMTTALVAPLRAEPPGGYTAGQADEAATLTADRIVLTGQDRLTAEGGVEVWWKDNHLTARRVVYDMSADRLVIEGPLRLEQPGQAGSVLVADQAELSRDLQHGVMTGARMVMARELQLAAARIERQDGTVTTLDNVVASSCQVCASDPTPLWEIRARHITHDAATQQLHFRDAQFRFMGVPLMWTPALRLPDPTVERMSGVLRPEFRTTTNLGPGVKIPYFFALGPSADLTLTPYLSANWTRTMGMRYRQAFAPGMLTVEGAVSNDSIREGDTRGYLFANGSFAMPDDFTLGVQVQMATDGGYLTDYDITDDDRLWSGLTLEKVQRQEMIWLRIGNTHSIREGESNATQPMASGDFAWTRVFRPNWIGGEMALDWGIHMHRRSSTDPFDTSRDDDLVADGRDMLRTSLEADWRRQWLLPGGILGATLGNVATDVISVRQDDDWHGDRIRVLPTLGAEVRWPWVAASGRASNVIEPVAQVLWSPNNIRRVPNEDSLLTEFDEGNMFAISRFPGADAREQGLRANLGASWTRLDAAGWSLGVTGGRVLRAKNLRQFPEGSGLSGTRSDWLLGTTLTAANGFTLANRALFDDDFDFSREEMRIGYMADDYQLALGYLWMRENALEGRPDATSELLLEAGWKWTDGWRSSLNTRYDFTAERAAKAAFGLEYANECLAVDLSLSRRFTSSSSVEPETSVGISVQLAGFGGGTRAGAAQQVCR
ncbi:LPS-assembly protein LptD [Paenirhodobacter sp.]|uniref:LPS-assembly protein LptD n=1 Tax=Paenirhodobacter sp. TaxID=1965326 RepID=UPI003B407F39